MPEDSHHAVAQRIIDLEARLIEQEHRLFHILSNFVARKQRFPEDDPRRAAAAHALIWRVIFSPGTAGFLATLTALVTAGVMIWQGSLMRDQTAQLILQTQLAQPPRIAILPEDVASGTVGRIQLTLSNPGRADLSQIEIHEDYFVARLAASEPLQVVRFGMASLSPRTRIPSLRAQSEAPFTVRFEQEYEQLNTYYVQATGARRRIARILVNYRRAVDGAPFREQVLYTIAGHGDVFLGEAAETARGLPSSPTDVPMSLVKQVLLTGTPR